MPCSQISLGDHLSEPLLGLMLPEHGGRGEVVPRESVHCTNDHTLTTPRPGPSHLGLTWHSRCHLRQPACLPKWTHLSGLILKMYRSDFLEECWCSWVSGGPLGRMAATAEGSQKVLWNLRRRRDTFKGNTAERYTAERLSLSQARRDRPRQGDWDREIVVPETAWGKTESLDNTLNLLLTF